jgi:hypothetical protein
LQRLQRTDTLRRRSRSPFADNKAGGHGNAGKSRWHSWKITLGSTALRVEFAIQDTRLPRKTAATWRLAFLMKRKPPLLARRHKAALRKHLQNEAASDPGKAHALGKLAMRLGSRTPIVQPPAGINPCLAAMEAKTKARLRARFEMTGGHFTSQSAPGKDTTLRVKLPLLRATPKTANRIAANPAPARAASRKTGTHHRLRIP